MTYTDKKIALEKVLNSKAKLETKVGKVCEIILDGSPNKGEVGEFFFLLHHGVLTEWLKEPLANRVRYVLAEKPESERLVRLTEMTPTLNVPQDVADAGKAYYDAWEVYSDARKAYNDARKAYNDARKVYSDAGKAYGDAGKAYYDAWKVYYDAWEAYDWTAIHKAQVPETTWDGKTIEGVPA